MRRFIRRLLSGLGVACAVPAVVVSSIFAGQIGTGAQTSPEKIVSYDVAIVIQHDASILVTEQIVYDFGSHQRHGIRREIPVLYSYSKRYDRYYPLAVRSVQSPDAPAQYTVDNTGDTVIIRIGDPNQTVTGVHTYRLTYLVQASMDAYVGYDALYWDAIGDQWNVPTGRATVRVTAPAAPIDAFCWAGPSSSNNSCQRARIANGGATFAQTGLGPHEALSVAVDLPKGVVAPPHPVLEERWSLQRAFALTPVSVGAFGGLLAILVMLGALVLARGRRRQYSMSAADLTGGTPAPAGGAMPLSRHNEPPMEPAPPEDLRPGQAGMLLDGVAHPRDVTGTIVDLAVRGYLRIEDTGETASPDWRLVRLDKAGGLLDYEQILLDGLFVKATTDSGAPSARLSELGSEFALPLKRAQDALYTDVTRRGWFTARPDRTRRKWRVIGSAMVVAGVAAVIVAAAGTHHLGLVPIPVALAGLLLIVGPRWMPVRTAEGTALARRVEGFRRYIKTAAVAPAHPAGQPDTLYDYLPYAIAFGCTKQWADLTDSLTHTGQAPSWYQTGAPFTPGSLSSLPQSGYFSSVHHFATAANNWVATTGSAAGGHGGGGGGSSGGGGGGGGGGSW
jgi:uncharacterized membrane protein YgcG